MGEFGGPLVLKPCTFHLTGRFDGTQCLPALQELQYRPARSALPAGSIGGREVHERPCDRTTRSPPTRAGRRTVLYDRLGSHRGRRAYRRLGLGTDP
ncbi:MAG: hypothetical protein L3J72_03740 [Thermoplasmata archaeon]|nr:hypothetical protein [Thermoplasmata archaeon]